MDEGTIDPRTFSGLQARGPGGNVWTVPPMTEKIEPALSAEEWAEVSRMEIEAVAAQFYERPVAVVAFANAALPDSDPRKITRETVNLLREIVANEHESAKLNEPSNIGEAEISGLTQLADALKSYLPPILHHGGPLDGQPVGNPVTGEDPPIPPGSNGYYRWSKTLQGYEWVEGAPPPMGHPPTSEWYCTGCGNWRSADVTLCCGPVAN